MNFVVGVMLLVMMREHELLHKDCIPPPSPPPPASPARPSGSEAVPAAVSASPPGETPSSASSSLQTTAESGSPGECRLCPLAAHTLPIGDTLWGVEERVFSLLVVLVEHLMPDCFSAKMIGVRAEVGQISPGRYTPLPSWRRKFFVLCLLISI